MTIQGEMFTEKRQRQAEFIAQKFKEYLNEWHSYEQPYDDGLDAWLHGCYSDIKSKRQFFDFKSQPHFSPSSADNCDRELYLKIKGYPRDKTGVKPYQRRWTALGTAVGDTIQRELLLAERHYKKFTGKEPAFKVARTEEGYPFFEDFVKTMKVIDHKGQRFSIFGTCDGVLLWQAPNGETLRIGLEIKSKQTSYTATGHYKMSSPQDKHIKQITVYSLMYNTDYYILLYVNASKKGWNQTEEDMYKYPDIRAFGIYVTEDMKQEVLNKFANVIHRVNIDVPPKLDIEKFTFNNFKKPCAESLTDSEFQEIEKYVKMLVKSSATPKWKKENIYKSYLQLKDLREGVQAHA